MGANPDIFSSKVEATVRSQNADIRNTPETDLNMPGPRDGRESGTFETRGRTMTDGRSEFRRNSHVLSRPNRFSPPPPPYSLPSPLFCPTVDLCFDSHINSRYRTHQTARKNTKSLLIRVKSVVLPPRISNTIPRYPAWVMGGVGSEYGSSSMRSFTGFQSVYSLSYSTTKSNRVPLFSSLKNSGVLKFGATLANTAVYLGGLAKAPMQLESIIVYGGALQRTQSLTALMNIQGNSARPNASQFAIGFGREHGVSKFCQAARSLSRR